MIKIDKNFCLKLKKVLNRIIIGNKKYILIFFIGCLITVIIDNIFHYRLVIKITGEKLGSLADWVRP